jgi:hypothetical protein
MHAHQRTLLASLGFNDADKGDPRHDLACQYLTTPENLAKIVRMADERKANNVRSRQEYMLSKGDGQYKTTIGFIDVAAWFFCIGDQSKDYKGQPQFDNHGKPFYDHHHYGIGLEVKIQPVGVGTILRQINLYKGYPPVPPRDKFTHWFVATAFPVSSADIVVLKNEGILHIFLGDKFNDFVEQSGAPGAIPADMIEL